MRRAIRAVRRVGGVGYGAPMTVLRPGARVLAILGISVLGAAALGGCAGEADADGPDGGAPAEPAEIAPWAEPAGIAPELVYVTDVDGFTLVTQAVGVMGDDGFSAMYSRDGGDAVATVLLTTSRRANPAVPVCADLPDDAEPQASVRCSVDRGGVAVTLEGTGVDPLTLRAAGEAVRVPSAGELDHLFEEVQVAGPPVERGDLPAEGDGAPIDEPGAGG